MSDRVAQVQALADRGLSMAAIGDELGVSRQAIHEFVRRHGIRRTTLGTRRRQPACIPLADGAWLASQYAGMTCLEIAENLKCSESAVRHAMRRHGIPRRRPGPRAQRGKVK